MKKDDEYVSPCGGRIITFVPVIIFVILMIVLLSLGSCGPAYHLRMAKKKGAEIKFDTTWTTIPVITPEIKFAFDTKLYPEWQKHSFSRDTLRFKDKKTGVEVKAKLTLKIGCPEDCIDELILSGKCPKDTVYITVPVASNMEIKAGYGFWHYLLRIGPICLVIGSILGAIFWASVRAWLRSLF